MAAERRNQGIERRALDPPKNQSTNFGNPTLNGVVGL
jgi:hypothetical protein